KRPGTSPFSRPRYRPFRRSKSARVASPRATSSRNSARTRATGSPESPGKLRDLQSLLGDANQVREGGGIRHGEGRQHLAVDLVAGLLQAVHQAAVRDGVLPRRGVDAYDPQAPEVALARLAVPVGVLEGLLHLELGHPVRLGLRAVVAAGEG